MHLKQGFPHCMFNIFNDQLPFIVNLLVLLLAAKLLGELAERFRQPSMIGEIVAGVILGPSLLNIIPGPGELKVIAELGVFMLIVLAGMEIEVESIRDSIRGRNLWIGLLGFIVPMFSGMIIGLMFNFSYTFTIFLGLCIAITALPVSIRILIDLGKINTDVGQRIISAAIFNDIVALLILGIILDFNDETKTIRDLTLSILYAAIKVGFFTAILMVAYHFFKLAKRKVNIINPLMDRFLHYLRGKESIFALVILFVLIFSSFAELLGLHFVIGAFFGAILIPKSMFSNRDFSRVQRSISGITMGFLAPIFFATMGISFNFSALTDGLLLVVVLFASFFSKIFGGYLGGRMAGFNNSKSLALGLGLNARGIMELVIANIALAKGFIDISMFSILVLMASLTTILTPFLLKNGFRLIDREESQSLNTYT
ncbi:MAG: cation:proton antiporter [Bacteroidales bacterium]|nr:cation:proton antiporter [Bacteroidales bacterium]